MKKIRKYVHEFYGSNPSSRIYGRLDAEEDEALLVICMLSGAMKKVFNAFYRSAGKYKKMF